MEFALVAPVFLALMIGIFEFGRIWMVQNALTHATREGVRRAILRGTATDAPVKQAIRDQLQRMQVNPQAASIIVLPSNLGGMKRGDLFFIRVQVDAAAVSWVPMENSMYLTALLTGQRE